MLSILLVTSLILFNRQLSVHSASLSTAETTSVFEETTIVEATTTKTPVSLENDHEEKIDTSIASSSDDVIELNIGGSKLTTLRSTLTVIPSSKLARMFSKSNANQKLPMDKHGAVFFDYNPMHFSYLLDQLRALKRMTNKPKYQVQFQAPYINSQMNFTHMLVDLGLTAESLLSPAEGTHLNLTISSLNGWKECYQSTYDIPFDFSVLKKACNGSRLLVACRHASNKKVLTLAGIGQHEDVSNPCLPKQCKTNGKFKKKAKKPACSSNYQCITQAKRGVGWYNANNQTWGFVRGSLSFVVDPCDSSTLDSDYRLCWTSQKDIGKGTGDRCGSSKNLQDSKKWERLIYSIA
ncbi:unnamed protein product [Adineta ricciae]|uniref:Potassium channel tetramerisation-type BTB domain-containing protein n=1 Tax=Adineta ricciae TaxID=249248 RepID=A0A814UWQ8_ADIRI|nr:unnamed protein product [Adineta ricciae]